MRNNRMKDPTSKTLMRLTRKNQMKDPNERPNRMKKKMAENPTKKLIKKPRNPTKKGEPEKMHQLPPIGSPCLKKLLIGKNPVSPECTVGPLVLQTSNDPARP